MQNYFLTSCITVVIVLLDQFTKYWFQSVPDTPLLPPLLFLTSTTNTGIAFSIPLQGWLLIVVTVAVIILGIYFLHTHLDLTLPLSQIIFGMLLGGGLGNLIDRVSKGYVVDFIRLWVIPVFNFADFFIFVGGVLLVLCYRRIGLKK